MTTMHASMVSLWQPPPHAVSSLLMPVLTSEQQEEGPRRAKVEYEGGSGAEKQRAILEILEIMILCTENNKST
jgi:hypothetical protein